MRLLCFLIRASLEVYELRCYFYHSLLASVSVSQIAPLPTGRPPSSSAIHPMNRPSRIIRFVQRRYGAIESFRAFSEKPPIADHIPRR